MSGNTSRPRDQDESGPDTLTADPRRGRDTSALIASAVALFVASVIMLGIAMALGMPAVAGGPMWSLSATPSPDAVAVLQSIGFFAGAGAVGLGIAAVGRGWRPSAALLVGASTVVVALYLFLPPAGGDTDVLNYAVYGRIAALGHSPYLMTPAQLARSRDPVGLLGPTDWRDWPTVYGPVATALQWVAAKLGGASMAWIVFWIKVCNAIAFVLTSFALVRLTARSPALQARVCILWAVNPLMLFWLVGNGHIDVLLALAAVLALTVVQSRQPNAIAVGLVTGLIVGAGTAIKTPFVLVALAIAWVARKSPVVLAAGLAGAAVVIIPGYLHPGVLDGAVLSRRLTWYPQFSHLPPDITSRPAVYGGLILFAMAVLAVLLLWRLPPGYRSLPYVRPAVALVLAWLVIFPTAGPWYDALIFPLLALMLPSWLDYLVVVQCLALSEMDYPSALTHNLYQAERLVGKASHVAVLLVPVALAVMCIRYAWGVQRDDAGGAGHWQPAADRSRLRSRLANRGLRAHPQSVPENLGTATPGASVATIDGGSSRGRHRADP